MAADRILSEKMMEDLVAENPSRFVGENGLRLIGRQYRIGNYIFDLLFEDRHGGKLIVELQIGTLDREHTYKILDYWDEYRERFPTEFVDVMVIANQIPPERQRRLRDRGITFREIPVGELLAAARSATDLNAATACGTTVASGTTQRSSARPSVAGTMTVGPLATNPARDTLERAVARIREECLDDPSFHSVRHEAETRAKEMLDTVLGSMSKTHIRSFLDYMNTENIRRKTRLTRFGRHFTNIVAEYICACPHEFNEWIGALWKTKEDALQGVLQSFLVAAPIKGAGILLPTFVLYLRQPTAFNIYTDTLGDNLARAFPDYQLHGKSQHAKYVHFNREVFNLLVMPFHLEPQEVDLVLAWLPRYL